MIDRVASLLSLNLTMNRKTADKNEDGYMSYCESVRCLLTFKDVEDSIDTFRGDDGQWTRDFDKIANLCR